MITRTLASGWLFLFASGAVACTCAEFPGIAESFARAETVVIASLEKRRGVNGAGGMYGWTVRETLKGRPIAALEPVGQGITSCDPPLADGQEWLLFLSGENRVSLGMCSPNRQLEYLGNSWRDELGQTP